MRSAAASLPVAVSWRDGPISPGIYDPATWITWRMAEESDHTIDGLCLHCDRRVRAAAEAERERRAKTRAV